MGKPLTVYTLVPHRHSASFYYRLQVPLLTAQDLGLPVLAMIDGNDAQVSNEERIRTFCEADMVLLYQPVGEPPVFNIRGVQSFLPSKRDGGWKWPPTVVVDSDDNLFDVSPLNQAYKTLGHRDGDGNQVPLGNHVGVVQDGERKVLWADGRNGFSFARNRQLVSTWAKILEMADAVTCSTPEVEKAIRKETTPRRSRVFPNLVRMDHYEQVEIAPRPNQVRVLWQGGSAHYEDWWPLREQLGRITRKYPQVFWVMWGVHYHWVTGLIPPERYEFKTWCPYQEYKLRLAMVGHDINLAPLSDNRFNRCRSAIKFYESSVLKKPAATLAQNTGAYRDEVINNQTGMLFNTPEEFESKLSVLIENVEMRRDLAESAKDWVNENRNAMREVPKWVEFWEELRAERVIEQPHVTDAQWEEIEREAEAERASVNGREPALQPA